MFRAEEKINDKHQMTSMPHQLILEDRGRFSANGIVNVLQCDDNGIVLETSRGVLAISGRDLSMQSLDLKNNSIIFHGTVDAMIYSERMDSKGFWQRLFR